MNTKTDNLTLEKFWALPPKESACEFIDGLAFFPDGTRQIYMSDTKARFQRTLTLVKGVASN